MAINVKWFEGGTRIGGRYITVAADIDPSVVRQMEAECQAIAAVLEMRVETEVKRIADAVSEETTAGGTDEQIAARLLARGLRWLP